MNRVLLAAFLVLTFAVPAAVLATAPSPAFAHGGQFRGPGGAVPPGLQEPHDPVPPPPPPPTGTEGPGPSGTPGTPTPSAPVTAPTPTPTPTETTGPTGGAPRGRTRPSFQDWVFWYHHNSDPIENLKRHLYGRYGSEHMLGVVGGGDLENAGSATRPTAKRVAEVVIPALRWAMDPVNARDDDTESAAYIALAKVARDGSHVAAIRQGLVQGPRRRHLIEESAALALGLLRRADPADQFSARELDRVRTELFRVIEDGTYADRTRAFAAFAIGLLGDQPTGSADWIASAGVATTGEDGDAARQAGERVVAGRLLGLLRADGASDEIRVAVLVAIGLQPSRALPATALEALAECALKGRLLGRPASSLVRAQAALALGRLGGAAEVRTLRNVFTLRGGRDSDEVRRSAAIGLGVLAPRVPSEERKEVARSLIREIEDGRDGTTKDFALISLGYLLSAELAERKTDLLASRAEETLLETAERGGHYERPFAAIALGLVLRHVEEDLPIEAWQELRSRAIEVLRAGADERGADPRQTRSACCVALGMAGDEASVKRLVAIVEDRRESKELRGYAAIGLGLIGNGGGEVTRAISAALRERSSDELRRQAATALGILGNPKIGGEGKDAVQLLLAELRSLTGQAHMGQVVLALSRIGDWRTIDPLVEMLKDRNTPTLTRALACTGLGLIGDLEWTPSLSRIGNDMNYRALSEALKEVLTIL